MWKKHCTSGQTTDDNIAHALAYWIPNAASAHSEYVTLISVPLQQWLQESVLMLRCPYIACLVLLFYRQYQGNQF
jgi:hypothetical protein